MAEHISPAEAATRVAAFFYLLTSLVVFPALLMAVQDLPSFPRLTYSRSLEPVNPAHIPFETILLGIGFIAIFLVPLRRVLSAEPGLRAIMACSLVATMVFVLSVFAAGHVYPLSIYRSRLICSDGYQICYPFVIYGYFMLLALTSGIAAARTSAHEGHASTSQ